MKNLREALLTVAQEQENAKGRTVELWTANHNLLKLLKTPGPVYRRLPDGRRRNIKFLSLIRVDALLRRKGILSERFPMEDLLQWLRDNWVTILKVLLTLLALI